MAPHVRVESVSATTATGISTTATEELAVALVGDAEHRAVDHGRVAVQHVLDLAGVHVHAVADDHVATPGR